MVTVKHFEKGIRLRVGGISIDLSHHAASNVWAALGVALAKKNARVGSTMQLPKMCMYAWCPGVMVLRRNRYTYESFWGCSNYPDCAHTEPR